MRPPVLLASGSPRRRALLRRLGITRLRHRAAEVDETPLDSEEPDALALRLAVGKSLAVPARDGEVVVAADTVVATGREVLGAPRSRQDAERAVELLRGATVQVWTGLAVIDPDGCAAAARTRTRVTLRPDDDRAWAAYLGSGAPHGVAGALRIQHPAAAPLLRRVEGCRSGAVGLPLCCAAVLLRRAGALGQDRSRMASQVLHGTISSRSPTDSSPEAPHSA